MHIEGFGDYTVDELKEFKNGYLRQSDYTKKTQELARQREEANDALEVYGLSYFMYKRFNRELNRSLFNASGNVTPLIKLAIIKFIYGHCEERFVRLSYLGRNFDFLPSYSQPPYLKRIY